MDPTSSYGPLINTVLGALGGLGGGAALGGPLTGLLGGNATAGNVTASAIGGILIPLIAGFFRSPRRDPGFMTSTKAPPQPVRRCHIWRSDTMPRLFAVQALLLLGALACSDGSGPPNDGRPVIATMTPNSWPAGGGAIGVAISGSNFGEGSVVTLDGVDHSTPIAVPNSVEFGLDNAAVMTPRNIAVRVRNAEGLVSAPVTFVVANGAVPFSVDSVTPIIPELAPAQQVIAWLSQAALPSSVTPSSVRVSDNHGDVAATPTYDAATRTIRVGPFAPGANYEIGFTSSTLSADGTTGLLYQQPRTFFVSPGAIITVATGDMPSLTLGAAGTPTLYYRALVSAPPSVTGLSVLTCPGPCLPPTAWQPPVTVDAGFTGLYASSVAGPGAGQVGVAYEGGLAGALRFAAFGGSTASVAASGTWSALTVMASGRYHLVYTANGDLQHLTCPSSCTTATWEGGTVDAAGNAGSYSAIVVDGAGRVHVAYRAEDGPLLRYAACVSPCVPSNWTTGTIGPNGNNPVGMSLISTSTGLALSYYDAASGAIRFGSCASSCEQAAQWTFVEASNVGLGTFGSYWTSLAQAPSGELVIAFQPFYGGLRLAACTSGCASGNWSVTEVSALQLFGTFSSYPSMKIDAAGKRHVVWPAQDNLLRYGVF